MSEIETREIELFRRLEKLSKFLEYKSHSFCRTYLMKIIKEFFKLKLKERENERRKV